ncbi:hypothetical protein LOTGIDRAFT_155026 [Lottia gigantea]|uniref:Uncharacterized protein n=1 Tax=Lottia gigantea TaxID=225164 RepID=V3ZX58_LOTGI|nr:hypothetical protein LOTGIDRAFT_155026 [Lottia gigantea]ESO85541.1 hypothetical protein LOTGIDRAFT_155026 [Lottia gigantea]
MANKFGLGSLPLDTKKPNTTAWINKAKPYFVDQIGGTLQGDLDMNNFKITNLKSPENDNDSVHKKYLLVQINSIEVNKNHLEDKISNVKRFFKRQLNNKNVINDTKLQQESCSAKFTRVICTLWVDGSTKVCIMINEESSQSWRCAQGQDMVASGSEEFAQLPAFVALDHDDP